MDIPEDFDLEDFEDEEPPEMYEMLGTVKIYLSMCILKILGLLVGIFCLDSVRIYVEKTVRYLSVRNFRKNAVRCLTIRPDKDQSIPVFRCPCPPTSDMQ